MFIREIRGCFPFLVRVHNCKPCLNEPERLSLFSHGVRIPISMIATAFSSLIPMETEEAQIARGLRRRDPDLLDMLIEQYQHRLLRYLLHLTGNHALAEDLFQETWLRVLEKGHQYDGRNKFSAWLFSIAHNVAIDYLRKRQPGQPRRDQRAGRRPVIDPPAHGPSALDLVAAKETAEQIESAMEKVPSSIARCWCCASRNR